MEPAKDDNWKALFGPRLRGYEPADDIDDDRFLAAIARTAPQSALHPTGPRIRPYAPALIGLLLLVGGWYGWTVVRPSAGHPTSSNSPTSSVNATHSARKPALATRPQHPAGNNEPTRPVAGGRNSSVAETQSVATGGATKSESAGPTETTGRGRQRTRLPKPVVPTRTQPVLSGQNSLAQSGNRPGRQRSNGFPSVPPGALPVNAPALPASSVATTTPVAHPAVFSPGLLSIVGLSARSWSWSLPAVRFVNQPGANAIATTQGKKPPGSPGVYGRVSPILNGYRFQPDRSDEQVIENVRLLGQTGRVGWALEGGLLLPLPRNHRLRLGLAYQSTRQAWQVRRQTGAFLLPTLSQTPQPEVVTDTVRQTNRQLNLLAEWQIPLFAARHYRGYALAGTSAGLTLPQPALQSVVGNVGLGVSRPLSADGRWQLQVEAVVQRPLLARPAAGPTGVWVQTRQAGLRAGVSWSPR